MEVVEVDISQLRPYWRNPRKNEEAVRAVKSSIERYGFNVPIVLDKDGVIIAGHTRYKAALELGWKTVPCVYSDMSEKKAKEYRIADNKTSEIAQWDLSVLKLEMREFDCVDVLPGFSEAEMNSLLNDISFGNVDPPSFDSAGGLSGGPAGRSDEREQERFDQSEAAMNSRFSDSSQKVQDNYVQVTCPHCAGEFVLDKSDMG